MKLAAGVCGTLLLILVGCGSGPTSTLKPSVAPSFLAPSVAVATATSATVPGSPIASSSLPSVDQLCALLTPTDWTTAGVEGAAAPTTDTDGPGTAYCTYSSSSGANGGLEMDAFVDATVADAQDTFNTMSQDVLGGQGQEITLPGADQALFTGDLDGAAGIAVRTGRLSYTITLPSSAQAQTQLMALAAVVLAHGQGYR